jgi:basic amino acid/polyamine antiporter, APA family
MAQATTTTVKPTLGLTGVTMNAMALIAPGAFLWTTYQLQAAATAPDGSSVAGDIWFGIVFALILAFLVGNSVLGGIGFGLMVSIAVTVALAILGTTLSCLNTAVRVTYAMSQDEEMPELLGAMHGRFATSHRAVWVLVAVSCVIAAIGVQSVVGLTGITLASNFSTFVLYGLTCMWTIIAFAGRRDKHLVKHLIVPVLGLLANLAMLGAILYLYIIGNADAQHEAYICFGIAGGWAVVSALYVGIASVRKGRPLLAFPAPRQVA